MHAKTKLDLVLHELDNLKAGNVNTLDVRSLTSFTEYMVIATGNSSRHVQSISDNLREVLQSYGMEENHTESDPDGEWVLVDLGDVIVHIMQPLTREYYGIEKLWEASEQPPLASNETGVHVH